MTDRVAAMDNFMESEDHLRREVEFKEVLNEIQEVVDRSEPSRKKRGKYHAVETAEKLKAVRFAMENGDAAACRKFSALWDRPINESTLRTWKKKYKDELAYVNRHDLVKMKPAVRGRPLKLGIVRRKGPEFHQKPEKSGRCSYLDSGHGGS